MPNRECYTVFGTENDPKIQFYHEVVSPKNVGGEGNDFARLHTQDYYELSFFTPLISKNCLFMPCILLELPAATIITG